jgi:hypothetical protein
MQFKFELAVIGNRTALAAETFIELPSALVAFKPLFTVVDATILDLKRRANKANTLVVYLGELPETPNSIITS